jgi:hypothetical protein
MRSVALQVCHLLMVSSNCRPGSAHFQAASAISRQSWRAERRSTTSPVVRVVVSQTASFITASMNLSVTRTELFAFWPETVR